jgi:hypothetical protein
MKALRRLLNRDRTSRQRTAGPSGCLENAEFMLPLRIGEDVEIRATIGSRGHRSRRLARAQMQDAASRHYTLSEQPELAARAVTISLRHDASVPGKPSHVRQHLSPRL